MVITETEVQKIAYLARIAMTPEECAAYQAGLAKIFNVVTQLNAVDTENIAPMVHPIQATQRLRQDKVTEIHAEGLLQKCAPEASVIENLYLVPPVIE